MCMHLCLLRKRARGALDARTMTDDEILHEFRASEALLEGHFEDLASTITTENGKTLDEARGEMRRAIENVEVACGIPAMMMGDYSEDVAPGVDEYMIRQPVGVASGARREDRFRR